MYIMDLDAVRLLHGADKPLIVFFLFPEIPESEHLSSPCISASPSFMDITSDSEPGTPTASPSVTRRNVCTYPPPSLHAQQATGRKVAVRSSLSTSDSDSSPHTSAVVVDNPLEGDTKNGWTVTDPEMSLKILPHVTIKEMGQYSFSITYTVICS